jgi:hypothetical protein
MKRPDETSLARAVPTDDDAVMVALAEGRLPQDEARTWRAAAAPERRAEADGLARVVGHLRALPTPKAPPELLREVERRVRRIRRARLTPDAPRRLAWEAVVNVLLLVGLVALYLFGMPARDSRPLRPVPLATFTVRGGNLGTANAVMGSYGAVGAVERDARRLEVTLPASRRAALEAELSLYPFLRLETVREMGGEVVLTVRVDD